MRFATGRKGKFKPSQKPKKREISDGLCVHLLQYLIYKSNILRPSGLCLIRAPPFLGSLTNTFTTDSLNYNFTNLWTIFADSESFLQLRWSVGPESFRRFLPSAHKPAGGSRLVPEKRDLRTARKYISKLNLANKMYRKLEYHSFTHLTLPDVQRLKNNDNSNFYPHFQACIFVL